MNNEKKIVVWDFDKEASRVRVSDSSQKADIERQFEFKLERYKDEETHEETIKIVNYKNGKENGTIVTSVIDLASDITEFKRFGVVIGDTYFRDLVKKIELVYLDINEVSVDLTENDERLKDLIGQVKAFAEDAQEWVSDDFYYIPVNMFNGLAEDCGYRAYEMQTLRVQLAKSGYIHAMPGRYAILKRIKGKPERVIAFSREKIGQVEKSETNG